MPQVSRRTILLSVGAGVVTQMSRGADPAIGMNTLAYATHDKQPLALDLYKPEGASRALPVIIFLHGGGWAGGTRTTGPDFRRFFAQDGFAMAAIEYRLTPGIRFPANVEDVRTAIRWLKANAHEHGLDAARIGLWGTSAGGHLAAVAALAPKGRFEGIGNEAQSSRVQCVLDAYGPTDFSLMDRQVAEEAATLQPQHPGLAAAAPMVEGVVRDRAPPTVGAAATTTPRALVHDEANSPESRLIGSPIQSAPEQVQLANPIRYVTGNAPPFLLMHGLADNAVPHAQSALLYEALAKAGNDVTLRLVDGLPHTFFNRTNLDDLIGASRMDVRRKTRQDAERRSEERAGVFQVARNFFTEHLK